MESIGMSPASLGSQVALESLQQAGGRGGADLKHAAQEFESLFLGMMMKEMRNSLPEGSLFSGESSDVYGGLFDMMMSQSLASTEPLGIARIMQSALSAMQTAGGELPAENPAASSRLLLPEGGLLL